MATEKTGSMTTPQSVPQLAQRAPPAQPDTSVATSHSTASPPSKKELASWWKKFRKNNEKDDEKAPSSPGIFGVPLNESIRYANVAISFTNEQGESFIYGYVPIVVAKCGVFLKEKATDVEGIFRLSGSAKRIKDLQGAFNSPDRYGKGLDWTGYTVHDAANILRRYLNQLPEPIVPLDFYDRFREPLRLHQAQAVGNTDGETTNTSDFDHDAAVRAYQKLITELPTLNRQLLLYILDLLAVFSSKSEFNRMNSANLAAIFQPGIISHPTHDMSPLEYRLSQDVLIFLIENQDNFLIGMSGTAVDEKTVKEVESSTLPIQSPKSNLGRSASNASAGAESLRKHGLRRNVSVSSRNSKERSSNGVPSPVTPSAGGAFASGSTGGSLGRSNTVPSKRSPALPTARFQKSAESSAPSPDTSTPTSPPTTMDTPTGANTTEIGPIAEGSASVPLNTSREYMAAASVIKVQVPDKQTSTPANKSLQQQPHVTLATPPGSSSTTKDRTIMNLFPKSPIMGASDLPLKDVRLPNKLKKKPRGLPGSANESAQSSSNSLHGEITPAFHTPLVSPELSHQPRPDPFIDPTPAIANTAATPTNEEVMRAPTTVAATTVEPRHNNLALRPPTSPELSVHSKSSITDVSDFDALDDPAARAEKSEKRRHRRWFSKAANNLDSPLAPPPPIGDNRGAHLSNSSIGSSTSRPRQSFTVDPLFTQQLGTENHNTANQSLTGLSGQDATSIPKDGQNEPEKRGLFGKFKARMTQSKEERKERDLEKERAKSPPRTDNVEPVAPLSGRTAVARDLGYRGKSMDKTREEARPLTNEAPVTAVLPPVVAPSPENVQAQTDTATN